MKHIKLFETRSLLRDQFKEFINFLNIDEDSLEVMLNWSAQKFGISRDALAVTSVERSEAESTMRGNPSRSSIHLDSDGLGQVGIHKLYYTEVFTLEEYTQIRDGIKLEHPELFKSRPGVADRLMDITRSIKSARYGIVFAWGPAGYFSIVPRGRAAD